MKSVIVRYLHCYKVPSSWPECNLAIAAQIEDFLPLAVCETLPCTYTSGVVVTSEVRIRMAWEKSKCGEGTEKIA